MNNYQPAYGDYFVVKTNGILGWAIRIGTFSDWNHAGIYIGNGEVIEARPKGVTISKLNKYDGQPIAWNQHENLTEDQRMKIVHGAHGFVGRKYGVGAILALFFKCLGFSILPLNKVAQNESGVICSQLVAWTYSHAGVKTVNKPHALVRPKDLAYRLIFQ